MIAKTSRRQAIFSSLGMAALLVLGGCETQVKTQRLPDITFAHLPQFAIDVGAIKVDNRFSAPLKPPHVEHRLPVAPAKALAQWADDRLKPVGKSGTLTLVIKEASATEAALVRDKTLKGHFTKQQSHRYDFAARATLILTDDSGKERATAAAAATRSITVREDVSLNERERIWFEVVDRLLADFNDQMEPSLRRYLASWLR